jgi:transcriptional/translational regulatory protein YebC/TACO1
MSGHSRWSQIKRKKGKADVQRGKLFSKILREITVAAKHGGGDPKGNLRLKAAMESARAANMPADNIKRAVQKGTSGLPGEQYEEITNEGYGPGGVAVLERAGVPVLEAQIDMVPQSTVRVDGKDAAAVLRLIEALEEQDDVQSVFSNYDIPDEVIDAISAA